MFYIGKITVSHCLSDPRYDALGRDLYFELDLNAPHSINCIRIRLKLLSLNRMADGPTLKVL